MIVKIDSEVIAVIRNALQIIMSNAELIPSSKFVSRHKMMMDIVEQVKRIDSLLPPVKFEG